MQSKGSRSRFVPIYAQDADVQYDSTWSDSIVGDEPVKSTVSPRGNSTAIYSFRGIAVYLYGYVGPADDQSAPSIVCYVDGNLTTDSGPFTLPGVNGGQQRWTSIQLCDQEQLDADSNHTIKVVVTHATAQYPFMLDQFMFRLSRQQYEDLNVALSAGASSTSPATSTSATETSPPKSVDASGSKKNPTVAILGGVLGAVVGLALTALGIYLVIRRRKQAYARLVDRDLHSSDAEKITPFRSIERRPSTRSFLLRANITPPDAEPLAKPELSTVAATFHTSSTLPQTTTPPPKMMRRSATGLLRNALRRASQRPEDIADVPPGAPPSYSAAAS